MGTFTQLGTEELRALSTAFDLGDLTGSRAIAAGTINSNFALETSRGRFFLRVNEGKAEADVAWEARLVGALAAAGVATPPPLAARDGRPYAPVPGHPGKWASAFPWRGGHHLDDVTVPVAHELGAQLARLHVAGLALPTDWRRTSIYDHAHLARRYDGFRANPDLALAPAIAIIGEELLRAASSSERREATQGIIHGDLFRDNVLWEGERITAILDFEQASGGSLAYDLAVCINDWCWTGAAFDLALVRALVDGYQSVRSLPDGDRRALPVEVRLAATRFTITRITDVYLANVTNPEKDFRAFLARVDAWRGPALGALTALL